ncbi:hypothetical protein ETD86_47250 [Nonomuraea turkmeniaca]|uniref:Uncharacterized protein n=1 Tax=Nonomuraea turkmeniaca TaxID=103838 RepID=A0A5S4EY24_9ACTN|nr:hypothetical protein [Nonomuraea turkmeniaca]TMR08562.1 hypothetical protein ETD86_47250 [Nonomuraea turkmeniaca]
MAGLRNLAIDLARLIGWTNIVSGCGSWATHPEIILRRNTSYISDYDFRMVNELWACSSLSCSTYYYTNYAYSY